MVALLDAALEVVRDGQILQKKQCAIVSNRFMISKKKDPCSFDMVERFTYGFALLRLELQAELLDGIVLVELRHFVSDKVYHNGVLAFGGADRDVGFFTYHHVP